MIRQIWPQRPQRPLEAGSGRPILGSSAATRASEESLKRFIKHTELARDRRRTRSRLPTRKQLVTQDWHDAPRAPKRGPRPLCHASDPLVRQTYLADFLAFVASFRDACERVLQGEVGVTFPDWCYPPGGRLVRPPAVA